ncbi:hypothetical protein CDD82_363 [Ophiocordyceps australis]|uniref:Major facilitator superfamily (MFS) profile domain-containing protein n=1 Tax=Ophiocordyceps australis TaxID=1399860 RepID=A0A2C5ZP66_9HYPO|nr:hypothetical protein CDD82_363 [Ophiocordyceps australis]
MAGDSSFSDETLPPQDASMVAQHPDAEAKSRSAVEPNPNREYATGFKLFIITAIVAFATFLMLLDNMIVSTVGVPLEMMHMAKLAQANGAIQAIPAITNQFHSLSDVGWYASAYQFGRYGLAMMRHEKNVTHV